MTDTILYRFLCRRGTAAALAAANEVPLQGEIYKELDTTREKVGDGVTHYNDLPYAIAGANDISEIADGDAMVWNAALGLFVPGSANLAEYIGTPYFDETTGDDTFPARAATFFKMTARGSTYLIPAFKLMDVDLLTLSGTFADVQQGTPYSSSIAISGGVTPYTNPIVTSGTSGQLPDGLALSISGSNLVLSGTSTDTVGDYSFTVAVDSADGQTATSDQDIALTAVTPAVWDAAKIPTHITRTSSTLLTCNTTDSSYTTAAANIGKASGKWIFQTKGSNRDYFCGIGAQAPSGSMPWINSYYVGKAYNGLTVGCSIGFENYNGQIYWHADDATSYYNGSTSAASGVAANVWLTYAVDLDNWTIKVFSGDTLLNSLIIPSQLRGLTYYPACSLLLSGDTCEINAGQSTITVPTPIAGDGYNPYWK